MIVGYIMKFNLLKRQWGKETKIYRKRLSLEKVGGWHPQKNVGFEESCLGIAIEKSKG